MFSTVVALGLAHSLVLVRSESLWTHYSSGARYDAYYDASTVNRNNGSVTVWAKDQMHDPNAEGYAFVMALDQFDCARRRKRTLQETTYHIDGTAIESILEPGEWEFLIPGTIGDQLATIVCRS